MSSTLIDKSEELKETQEKKEELEALLHEKTLRNARNDPDAFCEYIEKGSEGSDWLGQAELHKRWNKALTEFPWNLLICPREHGKTSQVIRRVVWEIGNNPNLRVKLVCQGDDTAVKRLTAIIDLIENNPRVQEVFPNLKPGEKSTWTKSKIYISRTAVGLIDPTIEASGILSTATGGRADLLVFDDPVDFRNAIQQPALRKVVKEVYKNVWLNILIPNGRVWYIATPWHKDDLTHELLGKENSEYNKITDSIDENFTPIWEMKWSRKELLKKYNSIGKRAFDKGFRNKALSEEDTIFTEDIINEIKNKSFKFGELPASFKPETTRYFAGIDLASGKKKKTNAFSVMFTIAVQDKIKVPVSIIRGQYKSPAFTRLIIDEMIHYNHELVFVENNNIQEAIIQWIEETSPERVTSPIKGFFTGTQKTDFEIGLPGLAVEMEHRTWVIPDNSKHSDDCVCNLCVWIKELLDFPIGVFSDTVMACWFAREAQRSLLAMAPRITILSDEDDDD